MDVIAELRRLAKDAKPGYKEGMARYGIKSETALGVPMPRLRELAKEIGKDHDLALKVWRMDIHEAKILAPMIDDPAKVTEKQMEDWVDDFDSWDVCDQCCGNLFDKTGFYEKKIAEWVESDKEFVRRAGFVLMAAAAVHDKKAEDKQFLEYLPVIERHSTDDRNYVRKAVNWALRQIGKRNSSLHKPALALAKKLKQSEDRTARWIGSDAARELDGKMVRNRLTDKEMRE